MVATSAPRRALVSFILPLLLLAPGCRLRFTLPEVDDSVPAGPVAPGPSGHAPLRLDSTTDAALDSVYWSDDKGLLRSVSLVRNEVTDPFGSSGGYIRQMSHVHPSGETRSITGTGVNGWNGWGYVVLHYRGAVDNSKDNLGSHRVVFAGKHHTIIEYKTQMFPAGPVATTLHYVFATGRAHPLYALTLDTREAGNEAVRADTRAPYGDMNFDGQADNIGVVSGLGWGDLYKFRTTSDPPLSMLSTWDYSEPNTIPHAYMWSTPRDAEYGTVQTETLAQHPLGGEYGPINACTGVGYERAREGCSDPKQAMPASWLWPFQLSNYELPPAPGGLGNSNSKRLAWGSNYGAVGAPEYSAFGYSASGFPFQSYSVMLVTGARSEQPVAAAVAEVESVQYVRLTATVGAIEAASPGGVGRDDARAHNVAGYDPVYMSFDVRAAEGRAEVDFTLGKSRAADPVPRATPAPGATTTAEDTTPRRINNPVFKLLGAQGPITSVRWQDVALQEDVGFFASYDAERDTNWITLNGTFTGKNSLVFER